MRKQLCLFVIAICSVIPAFAQENIINRQQFFLDEHPIEVTIITDVKRLRKEKKDPTYQDADIKMIFSDKLVIEEKIRMMPRGVYRKNNCDIASLMLNFNNKTSPLLSPLKKIKLVSTCRDANIFSEFVLREFATYKLYNLISNMSFRVRLLHLTLQDSEKKSKEITNYAFLIEDMKDLADRNNCREIKGKNFSTEATNRDQTTIVNLFQYMIGNTDWSIPNYHNVKLMVPKNDTTARPYAIGYDFDYAGIVNTFYAVPAPALDIQSVTERNYRGFSRSLDELNNALSIFKDKKDQIYYFIDHFVYMSDKSRKYMLGYIDGFYKLIDNPREILEIFIRGARIM